MNIVRIILVIISVLLAQQLSYAAFPLSSAQQVCVYIKATAVKTENRRTSALRSFFRNGSDHSKYIFTHHPDDTHHNVKGIAGKLSFIFGLCSIVPIIGIMFGIPAIIIGAIGIRKHQKHALAGLILGIATTILGIIITAAIFASM